jgi:hypothetical protein
MERLITWIKTTHYAHTNGDTDLSNVMLGAHYGSCHDHIHILRTMMKWGLTPPPSRLVDTLALFKVIKGMNESRQLWKLVIKYGPWIDHTPYDADSNADALRYVTMMAFPNTRAACYVFSISYADYTARTGLNLCIPSPMATFSHSSINPNTIRRPSSTISDHSITSRNLV